MAGPCIGLNFYIELPIARAIEFGEQYALPAAEGELGFFNEDELGCACKHCFYVGVSVAFGMLVGRIVGDEAVVSGFGVGGDIWVSMFVDQDAGRSVGDVQKADAGFYAGGIDELFDFVGYVYELGTAFGFYVKGLHSVGIIDWRCGN